MESKYLGSTYHAPVSSSANYTQQKDQLYSQDSQQIKSFLVGTSGKDGHVAPTDYLKARAEWTGWGYSGKDFDTNFAGFVNPSHYWDYNVPDPTKADSTTALLNALK